MNFNLLNISAFRKYKRTISEVNRKGFMVGGISFMVCLFMDIFIRLSFGISYVHWSSIVFEIFYGLLLFVVFKLKDFVVNNTYLTAAIWLVTGAAFLTDSELVYKTRFIFIAYSIMALAYSLYLIMEPIYHVVSQVVLCLVVSLAIYYGRDCVLDSNDALKNIIVALVCTLVGIASSYVRVENIVFKNEIMTLTNNGVQSDETKENQWDERSKVGVVGINAEEKRKIFSFSVNLDRKRIISIRRNNVFQITHDMPWDVAKEQIISMTADRGSHGKAGRFLDANELIKKFEEGNDSQSIILPFITDDKELRWFSIECSMQAHPVTSEVVGMFIIEDVSNDHLLMDMLNVLVAGVYESVLVMDLESDVVLRLNSGAEGVYGSFDEDFDLLVAAHIREHVAEYDVDRAFQMSRREYILDGLSKDEHFSFLLDEVEENGKIRKFEYKYTYIKPHNRKIIVTKQDVTDIINKDDETRLKIDAAIKEKEKAAQAKEEFLTRMSHEMRTPMNAILGLTALMTDEIDNKKALQGYIDKIEYSGNFLLKLINDMLDMSKLTDNQFIIKKEPYAMDEFWANISMMINPLAAKRKVEIEYESSIPSDLVVLTDQLRLSQIFINLINNSIKYSEANGKILFKTSELSKNDDEVTLEFIVKDNGIGMSEEFQKHMFEPFAQESKKVSNNLEGTGLGLSIVKGIITAMDGDIKVKSTLGVGTEVDVTLTFPISDTKIEKQEKKEKIDLTGLKILVVEDNEINREIAEAILVKKQIEVTTAVDGLEGLNKFKESEPGYFDAILMDIRMPVMNGLQATREIRALDRVDSKSIPIIAMTANAFESDIQASAEAGLNLHLSKPIEPLKLYGALEEYVNKRSREQ